NLRLADTSRQWTVVNCGGVSYASYRLVPILQEVLGYEPDLVILYTGHNEFLEDRTYDSLKRRPWLLKKAQSAACHWRTYVVAQTALNRWWRSKDHSTDDGRDVVSAEVEAMLDYENGLAQYAWDEPWRDGVVAHYEINIRRAVAIAREAGVPLLLVNPVENLRDCPPFKVVPREGLGDVDRAKLAELLDQGHAFYHGPQRDLAAAAARFERALAIDDRHAGARYELAECYDQLGLTDQARAAYLLAKDTDVCPLRMLESMHAALLDVANQTGTPLIDARALFAARSNGGIPDGELLIDHVHPNVHGHQIVGEALAQWLIDELELQTAPEWQAARQQAYAEHLASLDDIYFAQGQERLRALRGWTKGLAQLRPPTSPAAQEAPESSPAVEPPTPGN
ncbi:MAG: tetratricopeptide repeat protein, partial [Planctomycetales bacterium]|nr:tetratricopeptide repeat protein [Planctomycetales bacterium]